jgi:hypothetical protein
VSSEDDNDENSASQVCKSSPKATDNKSYNGNENTDDDLPIKLRQYIIKRVFGKLPSRNELVEVLRKKFLVPAKNLTALTASEIMSVVTRKLLKQGNCEINSSNPSHVQTKDIVIIREIEI